MMLKGFVLDCISRSNLLRRIGIRFGEHKLYKYYVVENHDGCPHRAQLDKFFLLKNLLNAVDKAYQNGGIAPSVRKALLRVFIENIYQGRKQRESRFIERFGKQPPAFLTISPTQKCNLRCTGCYADGEGSKESSLPFDVVHRIIKEKTESWGSHFTVVSGGEPFLWKSNGKDFVDLAQKHQDNYFLVYTNGTLIGQELAKRMAEAGNITPAISIEGLQEETDMRRGKGVFKKILKAFENLKTVEVPFGISGTATRENAERILDEEIVHFYFRDQGALYFWIFQYMPIGRGITLERLITPEQRVWMLKREREYIEEYGYFLADFWNGGPSSCGCISGGRPGGYFYIDWNGNVTPCVFFPYSTDNIIEIYERGGHLDDVLQSPLFLDIQKWQRDYGYSKPIPEIKNQIVPCIIRDHHEASRKVIERNNARPIDEGARQALKDPYYFEGLVRYGEEVGRLSQSIWDAEYLGNESNDRPSSIGSSKTSEN